MAKVNYYLEEDISFPPKPKSRIFKDLEGLVFGYLKVIGFGGRGDTETFWFCKCVCGNIIKTRTHTLNSKRVKSCGCETLNLGAASRSRHCASKNGKMTPTYKIWQGIKTRCKNKVNKDYGGRGITICERWQKFENFLADMGEKPEGLTLDRKDNDKGYYKENCRWATRAEQQNNRRNNIIIVYNQKKQTRTQWAREFKISPDLVYRRIKRGWPIERALTEPAQIHHKHDTE